jgi:hypothetical protein
MYSGLGFRCDFEHLAGATSGTWAPTWNEAAFFFDWNTVSGHVTVFLSAGTSSSYYVSTRTSCLLAGVLQQGREGMEMEKDRRKNEIKDKETVIGNTGYV